MLDWTRLSPAIKRAASIAASNFPAHHDVRDVEQSLWVWTLEKKPTVLKILADSEGSTVALEQILVKVAQSFLKGEDAATYCYPEEDQFFYSLDLIKKILEVVFKHEDWQSFASALDAMPKGQSEPAVAGNNLASYADVSRAVSQLPDEQYNLLVWRYKYQRTFEYIGGELGISRQAARERHETAVSALQTFLGRRDLGDLRRGYSGRAELRTNAASTARIERDYEG